MGEPDKPSGTIEPRYELVGDIYRGAVRDRRDGCTMGPQPIVATLNALENGDAIRRARADTRSAERAMGKAFEERDRLHKKVVCAERELEIVRRFVASATGSEALDAATEREADDLRAERKDMLPIIAALLSPGPLQLEEVVMVSKETLSAYMRPYGARVKESD